MSDLPAAKLPVATWLVPGLALVLLGAFLALGRPPVEPAAPPGLRTPEGKTVKPGEIVKPFADATVESPEEAQSATPDPEKDVTGPGPQPVAPIFPGATLLTDTPCFRYQIKDGDFIKIRDFYVGYFGKEIQYAESPIPSTGLKRAICFATGKPEAVQISETSDPGIIEIAIGPLARLSAAD